MSPTIARRLGACAHNTTKTHRHARISTTSFKLRETPPDFKQEHLDRVAWLQAYDISKLKAVEANIKEYKTACDKAHEFLVKLPEALQPLENLSPLWSLKEHQVNIDSSTESLKRLNDEKLSNLRTHVQDLQTEVFPEPGSDETELAFMQLIGGMTAEERQDKYNSLTMEIRAVAIDAARKITMESAHAVHHPFAAVQMDPILTWNSKKTEKGDKVTSGDNLKFGLGTKDQSPSVSHGATQSENSLEEKNEMSTANFGLGDDGEKAATKVTTATIIEDVIEQRMDKDLKKEFKKDLRKELKKELKKEPAGRPVSLGVADGLDQTVSRDEASDAPKPAARSSVVSRLARQTEDAVPQKPAIANIEATPTTSPETTTKPKPDLANIGAMQALLEASFKKVYGGSNKP